MIIVIVEYYVDKTLVIWYYVLYNSVILLLKIVLFTYNLQAANYLDIKGLLDVTCKTVANMIKGKSPEEIRKTFNIKNDFTPAEEEQVYISKLGVGGLCASNICTYIYTRYQEMMSIYTKLL